MRELADSQDQEVERITVQEMITSEVIISKRTVREVFNSKGESLHKSDHCESDSEPVHLIYELYRGSVHPLQYSLQSSRCPASLPQVIPFICTMSLDLFTCLPRDLLPYLGCQFDPFRPSVVIESCYMACPFPFLLGCEFDYVFNFVFALNGTVFYLSVLLSTSFSPLLSVLFSVSGW